MKLIAQKPCSFGGKRFFIGDEIPVEYVLDPKAQEMMGILVQVNAQGAPAAENTPLETVTVTVRSEEGDIPLDVTADGIQAVFDALTSNADDAKATIEQMTDGDALILLHSTDSRKSVQTAAETRAKELNEGEQ